MARVEFPRKVKTQIIARANGKCEKCGAILKAGEGEVDHILPCALGGEATVANGRLICRVCHAEKTAGDIRVIRKADRQRDKNNGAIKPASSLAGRKSAKPEKASKPLPPRRALYAPAPVQERNL